jgi:hypothetical protein
MHLIRERTSRLWHCDATWDVRNGMPRERLESAQAREVDYYFFASFFRLAAQYAFMRWDCALRAAADTLFRSWPKRPRLPQAQQQRKNSSADGYAFWWAPGELQSPG